jgi:hypothetical protein
MIKILMVYPEFPDTFWSFKHALRFILKAWASTSYGDTGLSHAG